MDNPITLWHVRSYKYLPKFRDQIEIDNVTYDGAYLHADIIKLLEILTERSKVFAVKQVNCLESDVADAGNGRYKVLNPAILEEKVEV